MNNITNTLNHRAELWGMVEYTNELLEQDTKEDIIKPLIYCNIMPSGTMNRQKDNGITESVEYSHKFKVRIKSIINPSIDMFFIFQKKKYEFKSFDIDFKNGEYLEIFTEMVME
ncbi:hypothetical protein [Clostridium tagluense]|uniref:hypothetical protein n=1 Tax=Clostridium tagluense TaxID=360422 RepID=UPI001C6F4683|nr:hypothetical protein [Clostridium tagluense]MBW9154864.1 hypothetical protein [Clostridium tagluense]WLC64319.1 hypothetical protein KTC93_15770 [Clostridium tagluense]